MRLVSYKATNGAWRAGAVRDGHVVDVGEASAQLAQAAGLDLSTVRGALQLGDRLPELDALLAQADPVAERHALELGPPVPDPDKILCIGLNYAAHADETNIAASAVPTVFAKFRNSLVGPDVPILIPAAARQVDYEGEMAVVIGRQCRRVEREQALSYVAGVMPLNDVSARDLQMQTPQWTMGKAVDTFAPCGPELVTLDEVGDVQQLRLRTRVNGEVVQDASTSQMLFDVASIVAFLSSVITLEPGDIVATGTPEGVGFTRDPPLFLQPGDEVEVELEGVGVLRNPVQAESR